MTDEVSQRERAINLCQELAIPENEQVLKVIIYALNKWTNPPQESEGGVDVPSMRKHGENLRDAAATEQSSHLNSGANRSQTVAHGQFCPHGIKRDSGMACGNCEAELRESTSPPQEERAEFEKWYLPTVSPSLPAFVLDRKPSGEYEIDATQRAWEIWQARAKLGDASPRTRESPMHELLKHVPPQYLKERLSFDYSEKRNLYEISSGGYILAETEDSEVADAICKVFNQLRESEAPPRPDCEMWSSPESEIAFDAELNPDPLALTVKDYEEVLADQRKLVRELDVIWNGDGAAQQASLCDIVAQIEAELPELRKKSEAPHPLSSTKHRPK